MKTKDLIGLVIAVALLAGAGLVYYTTQVKSATPSAKATAALQAEVVPVISGQLDPSNTLGSLTSTYQVHDFKQSIDLTNGLGNTDIFGK